MEDPNALLSSVQSSLVATTRSVTRLAAEDLSFHRSLHPQLGSAIDRQNARLLDIAQRLLGSADPHPEAVRPSLKDIDDVEDNWTRIVDVIDSLLERADTALDEFTGAVKRLVPKDVADRGIGNRHKLAAAFRTQDIEKPQLSFADHVNNYPLTPFKPLPDHKPHSITPLQIEPSSTEENDAPHFAHPYRHEIEQYKYPTTIYDVAEPVPHEPFHTTSAILVDTEEALTEMLKELRTAKEIAVDLEHHDTRSYKGIVCLMQISTRNRDWIVDTLKPWRRKIQCLNEVFADPSVIKVLHGAYMDIIWLQRDLGLYIVGLFDTFNASRALGYPGNSYAYLLKRFTGVDAQKQYQTADWRIRPLPQELIDYARSDTHYLLYVFDNLRNELLARSDLSVPNHEQDKIHDVLEKSRETALQRYEYPHYDYESGQGSVGWYKLIARTPVMLSKEQFSVFRAVHRWRDSIAREQDDNPNYVLPNTQLFSITHTVPSTQQDLEMISNLSQTAKSKAGELLTIIADAKAASKDGPDMMEVLQAIDPLAAAKRSAGSAQSGLGFALSKTKSSGITTTASSLLPLRTLKSLFWGPALGHDGQSKVQQRDMSTGENRLRYHVPLPPLSATVFAQGPNVAEPEPTITPTPAIAEPVAEEQDEVFTLRELGRKRKSEAVSNNDGLASQSDEIALPDEAADRLAAKTERKKARKEARRAARAAGQDQDAIVNGHDEDEAPYDYASAPSVLHQAAPSKHDRESGKGQFNPYAKALDTPKGLPRVQKEGAGRSMTYAS